MQWNSPGSCLLVDDAEDEKFVQEAIGIGFYFISDWHFKRHAILPH
jgi:hypothetical protein